MQRGNIPNLRCAHFPTWVNPNINKIQALELVIDLRFLLGSCFFYVK